MFSDKERIANYLKTSIEEISLMEKMSAPIKNPDDFGLDINGMTIFRACSMSLQYVTENIIQVRNRVSEGFFSNYKEVPWKQVFGMRNFLAHEYTDVDSVGIFNTIREDMPVLKAMSEMILKDLNDGKLDEYILKK